MLLELTFVLSAAIVRCRFRFVLWHLMSFLWCCFSHRIESDLFLFAFVDTCSKLSASECAACNCNTKGSVTTMCKSTGLCTCKANYKGPSCANRDCIMTPWSAWTTRKGASVQCRCGHTDIKYRSRTIQTTSAGEGLQCIATAEAGTCTMTPCNCAIIRRGFYGDRCENRDCVMNQWSYWKNCGSCPGTKKGVKKVTAGHLCQHLGLPATEPEAWS